MSEASAVIPAQAGIQDNNLPDGWEMLAIEDIADVNPRVDKSEISDDLTVSFVPMPAVEAESGVIDVSQERPFSEVKKGFTPFREGDVLFAKITPCMENGKMAVVPKVKNGYGFGSTEFHVLRPKERVESKYIYYFVSSRTFRGVAQHNMSGAVGQKRVPTNYLKQQLIPVAPPEQQKRIVAKIEELFSHIDAGIEALKKAKQLLKQYRQSVLKAAVTGELTKEWRDRNKNQLSDVVNALQSLEELPKPARWKTRSKEVIIGHPALAVNNPKIGLPDGWIWTPLVEIARMESGHTPSRKHPEWWDGDIDWIGIVDARQNHCGVISETIQHTNEEGLANSASRLLPKGTVCVSRTASVGYVVVMGKDMATSQDFVNWVPTDVVTSEWLQLIFIADTEGLRRFGKGTVHKTIYFPEWLSVNIGLPSVEEQKEIVSIVNEKVDAIQRLESEVNAQLIKAEKNKQSVLATAFSGILISESCCKDKRAI